MTTINEFAINPRTGAYDDEREQAAVAADLSALDGEGMGNMDAHTDTYQDSDAGPVEDPTNDVEVTIVDAPEDEPIPCVVVSLRDVTAIPCPSDLEFVADLTLAVEIYECDCLVDSGMVVKRIRISKEALCQELANRSCSTPITESKEVTAKVVEEKKVNSSLKRLRELAGIPSKGNWV